MSAAIETRPALARATSVALCRLYGAALLDLDGVVYVGSNPVPFAVPALEEVRRAGTQLAFVTNNASRTPEVIAAQLASMGIPASAEDVVTSGQAAAGYLARRLRPGDRVLVLGADALADAISERGLLPVRRAQDQPAAVVQGYSPDIDWWALAEGAVALQSGIPWIATNADSTLPSPRGPLPGNGALVAALSHATGIEPSAITGKPHPAMHEESMRRANALTPLVVGDRLDTDMEGAYAAGCHSLLVLSGIARPRDLLTAPPNRRPTYLAWDLRGLLETHPEAVVHVRGAACRGWRVAMTGRGLRLSSRLSFQRRGRAPDQSSSDLDALRALCVASWAYAPTGADCVGADDVAIEVLDRLGLGE